MDLIAENEALIVYRRAQIAQMVRIGDGRSYDAHKSRLEGYIAELEAANAIARGEAA